MSFESEVLSRLTRIETLLKINSVMEAVNMSELDDLKAQVAENTQVEASAVTLINGIAAKLASAIAAGDPAALTALHDELKTSADSLAAAVAANTTPAAPTP